MTRNQNCKIITSLHPRNTWNESFLNVEQQWKAYSNVNILVTKGFRYRIQIFVPRKLATLYEQFRALIR